MKEKYYITTDEAKTKWLVKKENLELSFDHIHIKVPSETFLNTDDSKNKNFFIIAKGTLVDQGDYAEII